MTEKFRKALSFTLKWEGGLSNHPNDPGGLTNRGIIQAVYNSYRKSKGLPVRSVRYLTKAEMEDIYYSRYWVPVKGDSLPLKTAIATFDTGVNMGPVTAIKLLQRACNDLLPQGSWVRVDGKIGSSTLQVINRLPDYELALALIKRREYRYHALVRANPRLRVFLKGWLNRIRDLKHFIRKG